MESLLGLVGSGDEGDWLAESAAMDPEQVQAFTKTAKKLSQKQQSSVAADLQNPSLQQAPGNARGSKAKGISFVEKLAALTFFRVCQLCGEKDAPTLLLELMWSKTFMRANIN